MNKRSISDKLKMATNYMRFKPIPYFMEEHNKYLDMSQWKYVKNQMSKLALGTLLVVSFIAYDSISKMPINKLNEEKQEVLKNINMTYQEKFIQYESIDNKINKLTRRRNIVNTVQNVLPLGLLLYIYGKKPEENKGFGRNTDTIK